MHCPSCHSRFFLYRSEKDRQASFCPFCGHSLQGEVPQKEEEELIPLISEDIPSKESVKYSIGPYQVLDPIGKGGMGEVLLAYDTSCGRKIALKKIREDLADCAPITRRFLKEARITSQLTHPAIIPIYTIQAKDAPTYYTMPFVEGNTLKQILRTAREQEKRGEKAEQGSISSLIRIFISVCQAVAYAHAKGVLHRDLKPENIIVGQYGQVVILDWGLAKIIRHPEDDEIENEKIMTSHSLTKVGKVVGTVSYMAPERAKGGEATVQTDIYSLGVILYQLLTLYPPFRRTTLKEYRKKMDEEVLIDPMEMAPYRDVPLILSKIATSCLATQVDQRYQTVDELIRDLENYIEGRSEWFLISELDIACKDDWEFQENVLIAEHMAITRTTEISDWVSLMISKSSFTGNIKLEADVRIGEQGHGLGFLLSIPEAAERQNLNDGYCLWIGTDTNKSTKLLRSTVEVISSPGTFLYRNIWYHICIEKIDNNIYFYINDILQFSYIGHLPLTGTHIGLLSRDADFEIKDFYVHVGNQNIMVNCLVVPDAFLAHKNYSAALTEYRRIGYSFPGRAEGREAMFRAGITLLEQANSLTDPIEKNQTYDAALDEFQKLRHTPGAPLEYLGKALVYQAQHDYDEEVKCYELAIRRYPHHPLLPLLQEHIVYRMHECSRYHRKATYQFILLVTSHLPKVVENANTKKLFQSLQKHWEPLPFVFPEKHFETIPQISLHSFSMQIAFWLAKPFVLLEIIDDLLVFRPFPVETIGNALYILLELGAWELVSQKIAQIESRDLLEYTCFDFPATLRVLKFGVLFKKEGLKKGVTVFLESLKKSHITLDDERMLNYFMINAIDEQQLDLIPLLQEKAHQYPLSEAGNFRFKCIEISYYLYISEWKKSGELLHQFSMDTLTQDKSILHFLYGCWLYATEGKEIAFAHFSVNLEVPYPRTWSLFMHYLRGKAGEKQPWFQRAFLFEKRLLFRELALFYHCSGDQAKSYHYQTLRKFEYLEADGSTKNP
ncbi:serine/threonine-protein kinase PknD [Parachlamydia acanthamoebae]|uniref:serine/threonine-protein kinase PknD n=1 Tax=Parachlamydia acanthamoebae TaxID=83552 RepID=UPI0007507E8C|nr:serine/threonine-protein kinase PknD [Parachlamydia acanthamoebae]